MTLQNQAAPKQYRKKQPEGQIAPEPATKKISTERKEKPKSANSNNKKAAPKKTSQPMPMPPPPMPVVLSSMPPPPVAIEPLVVIPQ